MKKKNFFLFLQQTEGRLIERHKMIKNISFGSNYYPVYKQPSGALKGREFEEYCINFADNHQDKGVKPIYEMADRANPFRGISSPNEKFDGLIESYCTSRNIQIWKEDGKGNRTIVNKAETDRKAKEEIANLEARLKAKGLDFQTCSTSQLFDELGVKYKEDENGLLILDSYKQPRNFTYNDIGVDENSLFKDIIEIKNSLNLEDSNATSLGSLERLGKYVYIFSGTNIEDLGNLKTVQGSLIFTRSKVKKADKLEYVGGGICLGEGCHMTRDMFKNTAVVGAITD